MRRASQNIIHPMQLQRKPKQTILEAVFSHKLCKRLVPQISEEAGGEKSIYLDAYTFLASEKDFQSGVF